MNLLSILLTEGKGGTEALAAVTYSHFSRFESECVISTGIQSFRWNSFIGWIILFSPTQLLFFLPQLHYHSFWTLPGYLWNCNNFLFINPWLNGEHLQASQQWYESTIGPWGNSSVWVLSVTCSPLSWDLYESGNHLWCWGQSFHAQTVGRMNADIFHRQSAG